MNNFASYAFFGCKVIHSILRKSTPKRQIAHSLMCQAFARVAFAQSLRMARSSRLGNRFSQVAVEPLMVYT